MVLDRDSSNWDREVVGSNPTKLRKGVVAQWQSAKSFSVGLFPGS